MSRVPRLVRGTLTTALLWGATWTVPGLLWAAYQLAGPSGAGWGSPPAPWAWVLGTTALWFALAGAQSGFTFALVVAVAEYRKRVGILTFGRTALWGVLGAVSVLLPGLLSALLAHPERPAPSDPVTTPLAFAVLGAFWAVASLWVARRPGGGRRAESAGAPEPRPLVAGSASFAARSRQAAADPEVV